MTATVYTSLQLDSPELLVDDLVRTLEGKKPGNALGFLLCDSQVDCDDVVSRLKQRLDFPVVGGTALSFPVSDGAGREISASLAVIERDNLRFSIATSQTLDDTKSMEQMKEVYDRCLEQLGEKPRMLIPFFPLMPGVATDRFIQALFELAGDIPVFGGTTTNDLITTKAAVFADGKTLMNAMVLVMIGGDVRPVFAASNIITPMTDYSPVVTQSVGNMLCRVDDMTFCDYMRTLGVAPEDRVNGVDAMLQYGPIPVAVESADRPKDDVPEVRCISYTNVEKGCAAFSSAVPEGARVSVGVLTRGDVDESAKKCFSSLIGQMKQGEKDGYVYSMVFCVSCVARYFVLLGGENSERRLLTEMNPSGTVASGFYAFCEIGPTTAQDDGRLLNRSHSASIVMCAL